MKTSNFFLVLMIFILSSCDDLTRNIRVQPLDKDLIKSKLVINVSTKKDIEHIFGKNMRKKFNDNMKEEWTYTYQIKILSSDIIYLPKTILFGENKIFQQLKCSFEHDVLSEYSIVTYLEKERIGLIDILKTNLATIISSF